MKIIICICLLLIVTNAAGLQESRSKRMVGGSSSTAKFVVSLQAPGYAGAIPVWIHFCGGAIVLNNVILTTATCLYGRQKAEIGVRPSSTTWLSNTNPLFVNQVIFHPLYTYGSYENDIAIIKLQTTMTLGSTIQAIRVPSPIEDYYNAEIGAIFGYPVLQFQSAFIGIKSRSTCTALIPSSTIKQICASSSSVAVCRHDQGGPLVGNVTSGMPYLAGLMTTYGIGAGIDCPPTGTVSLHTRITHVQIWIFLYLFGGTN